MVRDAATWAGGAADRPTLASLPTGPLGYAPAVDPYRGLEATIVPENVTLFPKTAAQVTGGNAWNERLVVVKKGESATSILREFSLDVISRYFPDYPAEISAHLGGSDPGIP